MTPEDWIAHDPDPVTAAELAQCDQAELAARFARPLTFGTAGLRGPVRGGPDAMNLAVVLRASWAVAKVLTDRGLAGSTVIVGRDARHGSAAFALGATEVLAAKGFSVVQLPHPVPTPVLAFAVRHIRCSRGNTDHRIAQSTDRQRLQGVSRRGDTDRRSHRPSDRNRYGRCPVRRRDREGVSRTR